MKDKDKDYNWRKIKSIVTYDESGKFPILQKFIYKDEEDRIQTK